jgi:hypothetical protein
MPTSRDLDHELNSMADDVLRGETATSKEGARLGVRVAPVLPPSTSTMGPSTSASSFHRNFHADDEDFPANDRSIATLVHLGSMLATLFSGGLFVPILVPLIARMAIKNGGAGRRCTSTSVSS